MLTTIRSPPSSDEFVSLPEYQSQTPDSFFAGKPILHYHVTDAKAWIPAEWASRLPIFPADSSVTPSEPEAAALNGSASDMKEQKVELFVNSECVNPPYIPTASRMGNADLAQVLDRLQSCDRERHPDPVPIHLNPRNQEHWVGREQDPGRVDAD